MDQDALDNAVLWRLCKDGTWSVPDLVRDLGAEAADACGRLIRSGLAYRIEDDLLVPSEAGRHAHRIDPTY